MRRLLAAIGCLVLAALVLPWAALGCTMDSCPMAAPAGPCELDAPMPCCPSVAPAPLLPVATTTVVVTFMPVADVVPAVAAWTPAPIDRPAFAPVRLARHGGERQALLSIFRI